MSKFQDALDQWKKDQEAHQSLDQAVPQVLATMSARRASPEDVAAFLRAVAEVKQRASGEAQTAEILSIALQFLGTTIPAFMAGGLPSVMAALFAQQTASQGAGNGS